ncbi:MAG: NUDIX domain-containing protein [Planctomycetes bacterium]|nr:NUDIX domain-containing protein [Planctomycetota bacterium]
MPELPPIDVAVVILLDGQRTLVNLRPEGSFYGGWWEWPGGKRNEGESLEQCARRELLEEIGLEAAELAEFARTEARFHDRLVNLVFFMGSVKPGSVAGAAALEHRWLTVPEVRELRFLEPNLPVLDLLEKAMNQARFA